MRPFVTTVKKKKRHKRMTATEKCELELLAVLEKKSCEEVGLVSQKCGV